MKKLLFLLFALSATIVKNYGQDSIFFQNNTIVSAKVLEITEKEIKYKQFDFQDGPTYSINRKNIQKIKYHNGLTDILNNNEPKVTEPKRSQTPDTVFHKFIVGSGLIIGIFNPTDVYDYIDNYNNYYNLEIDEIDNSFKNLNIGLRAFVGYRFTRKFDIQILGEFNSSSLKTYNSQHDGNTFFFNKTTIGFLANERIPLTRKLGINIAQGITNNYIAFSAANKDILSGESIGFRLQAGVNFYFSRLFTLQGLIGGDYANVTQRGFDMNYSGLMFTVNIIFNK